MRLDALFPDETAALRTQNEPGPTGSTSGDTVVGSTSATTAGDTQVDDTRPVDTRDTHRT